jgi:hypothetical protein
MEKSILSGGTNLVPKSFSSPKTVILSITLVGVGNRNVLNGAIQFLLLLGMFIYIPFNFSNCYISGEFIGQIGEMNLRLNHRLWMVQIE